MVFMKAAGGESDRENGQKSKKKKIYLLPGSSRDRWLRFLLVYQVGPVSSCDSCVIFFFGHVYQQVTIINNDKTFGTIITVKNCCR
jgi:hypothetical protein